MTVKSAADIHPHALAAVILFAGLLVTWFAYTPGMGGSLYFDDHPNLGGLAYVNDPASAFQFIAKGIAGPLGRPVALASFVPQAYAWPGSPEVFLRTNILIHLLNGILATWLFYLIGRARKQTEQQAALVAVAAAAIWMLMPILASSSLLIVQRMTTLSAVFTLLGAVGYMYSRQAADQRPIAALFGMTLAVGTGAALGALAKENGALLFLFILALEATLLRRPTGIPQRFWRTWFCIVLLVPFAMLGIFLVSVVPYSEGTVLFRGFNGFERIITQAEILWKYLYLAFMPNMPSLGPFHDDYPVQRNLLNVSTLLSLAGWFITILAAFKLRRQVPLFSFAVAWFLLGHLLESTTIGLELYFEHRNYLPLIGPSYALIAGLAKLDPAQRKVLTLATFAYTVLLGSVLFSTTSLWGSPALAAEVWHIDRSHSLRAAQNLADKLGREGDGFAARRLLNRYIESNPSAYGVRLEVLLISCHLEPESDHSEAIRFSQDKASVMPFTHSAVRSFQQLYELAREGQCNGINEAALYKLGQGLLDNPRFNLPVARHNIHAVLARIGIDQRDFDLTMSHMEEALNSYHNTDTLLLAIGILNSGGRNDISLQLLAEAKDRDPPRHPLRAYQWAKELDHIERALLSLEQRPSPAN